MKFKTKNQDAVPLAYLYLLLVRICVSFATVKVILDGIFRNKKVGANYSHNHPDLLSSPIYQGLKELKISCKQLIQIKIPPRNHACDTNLLVPDVIKQITALDLTKLKTVYEANSCLTVAG